MSKKSKEIIAISTTIIIISLLFVLQLLTNHRNYKTLENAVKTELHGSKIVEKYEISNGCFVFATNQQKKQYGYFVKKDNRWYYEKNVTITSHLIDNSFYIVDYYYRNQDISFIHVNNSEIETIRDNYNNQWEKIKSNGYNPLMNDKIDNKYYIIIDGVKYHLK